MGVSVYWKSCFPVKLRHRFSVGMMISSRRFFTEALWSIFTTWVTSVGVVLPISQWKRTVVSIAFQTGLKSGSRKFRSLLKKRKLSIQIPLLRIVCHVAVWDNRVKTVWEKRRWTKRYKLSFSSLNMRC